MKDHMTIDSGLGRTIATPSRAQELRTRPRWAFLLALVVLAGVAALTGFAIIFLTPTGAPWMSGQVIVSALVAALGGSAIFVVALNAFLNNAFRPGRIAALEIEFPGCIVYATLLDRTAAKLAESETEGFAPGRWTHEYFFVLEVSRISLWRSGRSELSCVATMLRREIISSTGAWVSVQGTPRRAIELDVRSGADGKDRSTLRLIPNSSRFVEDPDLLEAASAEVADWVIRGRLGDR